MPVATDLPPSLASPILPALSEDLQTCWVPDPLGLVDAESQVRIEAGDGTLGVVEQLRFPKPDGTFLRAPVLALPAMGQFHRSVEALRAPVDVQLSAGVCGYRRGAEEGFSYSSENVRFQQLVEAEADNLGGRGFVVFADVEQFFEHCPWDLVLNRVESVVGDSAAIDPLRAFARAADASGLTHLPAGYANSRLLANAVLAGVDESIHATFARWVDDYRVFVHTPREAELVLDALRLALGHIGMNLNEAKTEVVPTADIRARSGAALESVYHPDVESPKQVQTALRSLFLNAVQDPDANRRSLRFALPRLAEQRDDIAVEWVLSSLHTRPWEAPRFARYLLAFAEQGAGEVGDTVRRSVQSALVASVQDPSPWLSIRLAALTCHTGIDTKEAGNLAQAAQVTPSVALWSLLLRSLSLSGHRQLVQDVLNTGVRDARVALACLRDLNLSHSTMWCQAATMTEVDSTTLAALKRGPAPRPDVASIL